MIAQSPVTSTLPRRLGMWDSSAIVVGIVIGSGIFLLPNLIARNLPSATAILAAWILSGVLSFFGALAYAELGAMMPATGGQYVYLREAYGPLWAFVCGWTFMLAVLAGGTAWLTVTFSIYLGHFLPLTPVSAKVASLGLLAVLSAVNYVGVREGVWVQRTFTFLKVTALVVLITAALLSRATAAPAPSVTPPAFSFASFGVVMTACLMAYNGWSYVSFVAGEVREPQKNLLRALTVGMTAVGALYILANVAYLKVMTISEIAASERVGADLATRTIGPIGGTFVSLAVLCSITGAVNGCILTAARLPFAQARDGLFFSRFGRVHPRFETPGFAIILGGLWTAVLILSGSYESLYSYSILAAWIFYTMSVAAVFVLRRKLPDALRPYKMWGYPYTLWAFVGVSVWYIVNALITQFVPSAMALAIVAAGLAAYRVWRKPLTVAVAGLLLAHAARGQDIRVYVTSQAGDRITSKAPLKFSKAAGPAGFHVDEKNRDQEIVGFGASFLEAGAICLNSLDAPAQEKVLQSLFDPEKGAGFSAMKTVIGATDFMSAGPFYTYNDHPGDTGMKLFSIARDLEPNGLIPFIKRSRRYGKFVLQAPMDYPPDWMLIDVKANQDVDPRYFDALALYYLRYAREYEKQGVFVDYVSLFNEPRIYTKISPEKVRDLLKDHVGPLFAREGVKNRIQACETNDRQRAAQYWPVILDDPQARKYSGAMAYHAYGYKDYDRIADLHRRYPDQKLWMTEVCHAYETGLVPRSVALPRRDYEDGDFWGNEIFNDLESGASAWIYWNMILDERGGPWLISEIHHDPDNNEQHPVVVIDRRTKEVTYTGLYYYLAHFSKFVRPGAVRVGATGTVDSVRCLAFQRKEGTMVAQLLNRRKRPVTIGLEWQGKHASIELPALSIVSCLWKR